MAIAFAQNLGDLNTASATSLAGTFGSSTVSGNLILNAARVGAQGHVQTFTDSKSNTWATPNPIELDFPASNHLSIGYALNITGGASHQLTLTIDGAAASIRMVLWEESGIATSSALDKTSTGSNAAEVAIDSGSTATTTQADEWVFAAAGVDGSGTATAGATFGHIVASPAAATTSKIAGEDKIVAATGTYNGTFTFTAGYGGWGAAIVTFKGASSATSNVIGPQISSNKRTGGLASRRLYKSQTQIPYFTPPSPPSTTSGGNLPSLGVG